MHHWIGNYNQCGIKFRMFRNKRSQIIVVVFVFQSLHKYYQFTKHCWNDRLQFFMFRTEISYRYTIRSLVFQIRRLGMFYICVIFLSFLVTFSSFVFFEAEMSNFTQRKNNYNLQRIFVYFNRKRKAVSVSVDWQNCSSILNSLVGSISLISGCQLWRACKGILKV